MLKGEIIRLKAVDNGDIPYFLEWYNDPSITQFIESFLPISKENEEEWVRRMTFDRKNTDIVFTIIDSKNNTPIGTCGLHKINYIHRSVELSIIIGNNDYWGRGYGTEVCNLLVNYAFSTLNLNRIYSGVYDFNDRSLKLFKKLGFKKEGCQHQSVYKNGKYHNTVLFGLIRKK